ncbi:hypothetical protein VTN02DRAFT_669 [Thermoascus thermophilus]
MAAVVAFVNGFEETTNTGDQGLFFGFTRPPFMDRPVVVVAVYYNGPQADAEAFFAPLLSLGPLVDNTGMMAYEELNAVFNGGATYGGRKSFGGARVALPLDVAFVAELYDDFAAMVRTYENVGESLLQFEIIPYTQVIQVPRDATSCAHRGRGYNVASVFRWYDPGLDGEMRRVQHALMAKIRRRAGVTEGVGLYANYSETDTRASEVFGANLPRLQALKRRYDPRNVFQKGLSLLE